MLIPPGLHIASQESSVDVEMSSPESSVVMDSFEFSQESSVVMVEIASQERPENMEIQNSLASSQ